jgi:hypothetical protein
MSEQLGFDFELPAAKPALPMGVVDADASTTLDYKDDPDLVRAYWWATNGGVHGDWWRALPIYERNTWVMHYKTEVALAGPDKPIRSARQVHAALYSAHDTFRTLAIGWALEIEEAWKAGKPCPIIPEPRTKWVLDWAFNIAKVPRHAIQEIDPQAPLKA